MTRVKRGKIASKRRKNLLKHAKGFRWGRKTKYRQAKEALFHAWVYAFRDRKVRKREKRALWQVKIGAAARKLGLSYSKFMAALKKKNIELDRKILAELAQNYPQTFQQLFELVKS